MHGIVEEDRMHTALQTDLGPMDIRALHERMGRVYHQPVRVHSFTNKRFTVNFRVPLDQLRRIVPGPVELDEIRDTGLGVLSMCACDFWVSWLGWLPIPPVRNNDMLCRVSAKVHKAGKIYRAYYTLRSDSSSRFLGFFGKRFSHFRKQIAPFVRLDDGSHYRLECQAADPLCRGKFQAVMSSVTKEKPDTTIFADIEEAKHFVFDLDGSCGYEYGRDMLSFQKIDYPPWDMYFCREYSYEFPLIDYLCETFDLRAELDCVLFMQNTSQTWGSSRLYRN
jgi:hypothetical protein